MHRIQRQDAAVSRIRRYPLPVKLRDTGRAHTAASSLDLRPDVLARQETSWRGSCRKRDAARSRSASAARRWRWRRSGTRYSPARQGPAAPPASCWLLAAQPADSSMRDPVELASSELPSRGPGKPAAASARQSSRGGAASVARNLAPVPAAFALPLGSFRCKLVVPSRDTAKVLELRQPAAGWRFSFKGE